MNPDLKAALDVILRWSHVLAGIMWVGTTYYFTWLDGRFTELEEKLAAEDQNVEQGVWMVHSGGFYRVEKQKRPQSLPRSLHWFRWEAAFTWLTGFLLFGLLYWHGGILTSMEETARDRLSWMFPGVPVPGWLAALLTRITDHPVLVSGVLLVLAWVVYDLLWSKCLKDGAWSVGVAFALVVLTTIFACIAFAGRGAYLQLGAMFGTIMAANVWMRILPAQRRMVAALKVGAEPDLAEAARAKTRSKHNTFIVIPLVFIMISHHYPVTYGSRYNWLILSALVLLGWGAARIIRRA